MPPAYFQPIAAEDVANALLQVVLQPPLNGIIEIAGPERLPFAEFIDRYLKAKKDPRTVVSDVHARYFGAELSDNMLVPGKNARLGSINFTSWLESQK